MYNYTKQEVQEFLGTETTVNNNLLDGLKRKGFEAKTNGKRGTNLLFILDKELVDPMMEEFGFKPALPNYMRILIKVLREDFGGVCLLTYRELSEYIEEHYNVSIDPSHLGATYRELVANEKAPESKLVKPTLIKDGKEVDEETEAAFKLYISNKVNEGYEFGRVWNIALECFDLKSVKGKIISAY